MKVWTEVEVDLSEVADLEPISKDVNDFLADYEDNIEDAESSEIRDFLNKAVELLMKVQNCFL